MSRNVSDVQPARRGRKQSGQRVAGRNQHGFSLREFWPRKGEGDEMPPLRAM